ncbi:hypothetical protein GIB67_042539 [Kingdonia uniflora]|uniref:Uncharacterized protein n=1 Tax=Kingdonia uniflora TaxID=39325 RepID=A0A7J7M189_9MAGN|nr:hypothetical protein GIB67_042539 [Kingdonia uniflora]
MAYEEVVEAEDDHHQMVCFHYLLTSEERRNGLRLLAEEAITAEDEATGVHPRESHRYLAEWSLKLGRLDDEGRRAEYAHFFWCDVFCELVLDATL